MENASKALIMAAGVLLGIMIISLGVYLYTLFGNFSKEQTAEVFQKTLSEFNNQFLIYESKEDITAQDVVTVANLARNNNEYYGLTQSESNNYYISVECNGQMEKKNNSQMNQFIQQNAYGRDNKAKYYNCKISINPNTGKVNKVTFTEK